eukprot:CAMPEP_0197515660 /NCGR_PEP_ID=MMETSP1318-20131121/723_1 /TAXON_ID=552666 /ORGANISM="Partenskyella glossopodia, Strain RCC365" /LENGTH=350 /DNA_ID=CAMNT_0043064087 /DNA_START=615 /DNA_END=1667 /DNA_ORIENTATION=-
MRAFWMGTCVNLWLSTQLNLLATAVLLVITFFSVYLKIDAGLAGLSTTYGFAFCFWVQACIKAFTRLEMNMNAIERTNEYSELVPEGDPKVRRGDIIKNSNWPEFGRISLKNVSLRYRDTLPLVLKDLTLEVDSGMKVGICGRTGAGKSSLMAMLFRLCEPEGGELLIDGVEVRRIHLHDLRSKIGVIPQDPTIFSATVRSNLDPYEAYEDQQVWHALDVVQMSRFIRQIGGLDHGLNGDELSVGQKQLLCVARAILRKPKVLILDEATASIDFKTDKLIQTTIADTFKDVTVLTIAHRIETIRNYDRILVLDAGKIAEFGHPEELLKKGGIFAGLVKESEASEEKNLEG